MNKIPVTFAKLAALYKELDRRLSSLGRVTLLPNDLIEYYIRYADLRDQLMIELADLYSDLPNQEFPNPMSTGILGTLKLHRCSVIWPIFLRLRPIAS